MPAYRDDRRHRSQAGPSLAEVADQFAVAVGAQWQAETAVQRLNEPYPLPVSWAAADESLADPWHVLVRLATSGAGWPSPRLPVPWAAGAGGLAGDGGDLVRVLARETAILISAGKVAWPSYLLACAWLALRRRLPWRLMDFLADAHRRGILRQAGPVYQFRHIELQHHLAGQARPRLPVPGAPAGARGEAAWPAASRPD